MRADARVSRFRLRGVACVGELFEVVHETKQLPLRIDLHATTQRETIEPLVVAQIRKHRLDGRNALSVLRATGD